MFKSTCFCKLKIKIKLHMQFFFKYPIMHFALLHKINMLKYQFRLSQKKKFGRQGHVSGHHKNMANIKSSRNNNLQKTITT